MTHTVHPTVLRLGYKLNWTFLHNYIYISKTFRFTLLINAILLGFLRKYNYTLVKYFVNLETTKCKILVVALRNFGFSRKLINFSFFKWTRGYKIAFFKMKRKFVYSIKHSKLKFFLKKFEFNKFNTYKRVVRKNYAKADLRNFPSVSLKKFKEFRAQKLYSYYYKKFVKKKLNDLFNSVNNSNLTSFFFNNFLNNTNDNKSQLLNHYNIYNFYTLWTKTLVSKLSNLYFLKTFDNKGFSPFWLKRYKFLSYFNTRSKLFFFKFLNKKLNTNLVSFFKSNSLKKKVLSSPILNFSSFFNRFLKNKYAFFYAVNISNYSLIFNLFFYLLKLKNFFYYYYNFFHSTTTKFNGTLFIFYNYLLLVFINKLIHIFNKNYFFFNKNSFFKYYFNNLKYILKLKKTNYKKSYVANFFSILSSSNKLKRRVKNSFYETLTYYTNPVEYDKPYFKYLKFKFLTALRLDRHLYGKYSFPFSDKDALSYKIMHTSILYDAHEQSKLKTDPKNLEIKNYSANKRVFYFNKFKKYIFKKNILSLLKSNINFKKNKNCSILLLKKIKSKISILSRLVKKSRVPPFFNHEASNFFISNFCFLVMSAICKKLNKKITIFNSFLNIIDDDYKLDLNSTELLFNSYTDYNNKLLILVKDIYFKYSYFTTTLYNKKNLIKVKKINKSSFNFNLLLNFKLNLLNTFYASNINANYPLLRLKYLAKFYYNSSSNLVKDKSYNLILNLVNFFYYETFSTYSFFYRPDLLKHKRHLLFSLHSHWLIKRKKSFFLEKEFEKIFRINTNIAFVNPLNNFLTSDQGLGYIKSIPFIINKVYMHPKEKKNMVYLLIIFFLSLKLRTAYLLSNYLTIMIEKREKHFEFFTVLKRVMSVIRISEFNLGGLTIGLYGKVNGKDRAYRYFIHKFIKPSVRKQCLILNSELSHCYSRYGVFGVRIWMHEF